jgi:hypothetical protein
MAIVVTLAESTQHRLRYLLADDGEEQAAPSLVTILNAAGATPDLRTDSHDDTPIHLLVSTACADDAAAHALLEGYGIVAELNEVTPRAHIELTPKNNPTGVGACWGAAAAEGADASNGYAIINIEGPNVAGALCYLDVIFEHSQTR